VCIGAPLYLYENKLLHIFATTSDSYWMRKNGDGSQAKICKLEIHLLIQILLNYLKIGKKLKLSFLFVSIKVFKALSTVNKNGSIS